MAFTGEFDNEVSEYEFQVVKQLAFMMYVLLRFVHIELDNFELESDIRQMMWQIYSELALLYRPVFQLQKDLYVERLVMGNEEDEH